MLLPTLLASAQRSPFCGAALDPPGGVDFPHLQAPAAPHALSLAFHVASCLPWMLQLRAGVIYLCVPASRAQSSAYWGIWLMLSE